MAWHGMYTYVVQHLYKCVTCIRSHYDIYFHCGRNHKRHKVNICTLTRSLVRSGWWCTCAFDKNYDHRNILNSQNYCWDDTSTTCSKMNGKSSSGLSNHGRNFNLQPLTIAIRREKKLNIFSLIKCVCQSLKRSYDKRLTEFLCKMLSGDTRKKRATTNRLSRSKEEKWENTTSLRQRSSIS